MQMASKSRDLTHPARLYGCHPCCPVSCLLPLFAPFLSSSPDSSEPGSPLPSSSPALPWLWCLPFPLLSVGVLADRLLPWLLCAGTDANIEGRRAGLLQCTSSFFLGILSLLRAGRGTQCMQVFARAVLHPVRQLVPDVGIGAVFRHSVCDHTFAAKWCTWIGYAVSHYLPCASLVPLVCLLTAAPGGCLPSTCFFIWALAWAAASVMRSNASRPAHARMSLAMALCH